MSLAEATEPATLAVARQTDSALVNVTVSVGRGSVGVGSPLLPLPQPMAMRAARAMTGAISLSIILWQAWWWLRHPARSEGSRIALPAGRRGLALLPQAEGSGGLREGDARENAKGRWQ